MLNAAGAGHDVAIHDHLHIPTGWVWQPARSVPDRGAWPGTPATVAADGTYSAVIPTGASGPFVLEADNGTEKWVSVMADTTTPVANITSVSHLVAARLSPTGDPFALSTQIASNPASVSAASASAATKSVMDAMQPLASALALPSTLNPLTSPFTTNGQGFDKMLDSIDVKIEPQGQRSKLEVTVNQAVSETDALPDFVYQRWDCARVARGSGRQTRAVGSLGFDPGSA